MRKSRKSEADGELAKTLLRLRVNGEIHEVATEINKTLLEVLREDMALTGTKHGCELGECGTCSVLVDGKPILSCLLLGIEAVNAEIVTVEGMMQNGKPHPLQKAFADLGAAQCGYCIPGILLTAQALLDENPNPSRDQIRQALSGNLCRCTGYTKILQAVELAAKEICRVNEASAIMMRKDEILRLRLRMTTSRYSSSVIAEAPRRISSHSA